MKRTPSILVLVLLAGTTAFATACDNDPAEASVTNEIPGATIEKTWFRTTLFTEALETGQTSRTLRIGVGTEPAYAIVKINGHVFVAKTNDVIDGAEGEQTRIVFSPTTARSLCFGEPRLSTEDEQFVRTRIFPGDEITSDAASCEAR